MMNQKVSALTSFPEHLTHDLRFITGACRSMCRIPGFQCNSWYTQTPMEAISIANSGRRFESRWRLRWKTKTLQLITAGNLEADSIY